MKRAGYVLMQIIMFISSALLTYWMLIDYSHAIASLSMAFSGCLSLFIYHKKRDVVAKAVRANKKLYLFAAIFLLYMLYLIRVSKGLDILFYNFSLIKARYIPLVFVSAFFYGVIAVNFFSVRIKEFAAGMSSWDKKAYAAVSILAASMILLLYCKCPGWYLQYDNVYSIDSGFCFGKIFPQFTYYDIRHPLLGLYTFPLYAFLSFINFVFVPEHLHSVVYALGLQVFNSQLLIIMAFMIKKITDDSKEMFLLFISSYSVVMYMFLFEKYPLCIFFLVSYVYYQCSKKEHMIPSFISSAFTMPTSAFLGVSYLFTDIPAKRKIKTIFYVIIFTICGIICLGRGNILLTGLNEAAGKAATFGGGDWTMQQKIISLSKLWQGAFVPVHASQEGGRYFWLNLTDKFDTLFFILLILIITGIITHLKDFYIKTSICWLVFSFILIVAIQWSTSESPLFSLYFAWALIPALKYGLDYFIKILKLDYKMTYRVLCVFLLLMSAIDLSKIQLFLEAL